MECQICFEPFDIKCFTPKILTTCGHSFCKICLKQLTANKVSIKCPVCRERNKIHKSEVLPTNYSLIEIIEKEKDIKTTKDVLLKYKYFSDKDYNYINPVITRYFEPKKLILK